MTLPIVILLGGYLVWPVLRALYISLFDYQGLGTPTDFIGLDNYARAFTDPELWLGLARNVFYCVFILAIGFTGGAWLAFMLFRKIGGWKPLQVLLFIPNIIPVVVVALLWRFIFQPGLGLADQFLKLFGFEGTNVWFGDPSKAMVLVALAWAWTSVPMWTLLIFVTMLNIPSEMLESARMDGATERQVLWHIVMPAIRPILWLLTTMTVLSTFRNFDLVYLLGQRVPGNSMTTGAMYVYNQAFEFNNYGYGTAAGFVVALVIAVMMPFLVRQISRRNDE